MTRVEAVRSLRISQGIFSIVNFGLASYLVHELAQTTQQHVTSDVFISLVAACVSVIGVLCAPRAANLSKMSPKLHLAFAVDWITAFFNMAALISLAVFVTKSQYCQATTCLIAKASTVLTAFNFINWAATATFLGIEISKLTTDFTERSPPMGKVHL
ncbi:uncharacterized protein EKO05_0004586 [Ascochyta rabiei]|uniref:uncharacterized protein n=1 Tax=Didymella rabiei TaxID=5454 RepID=UPI0022029B78|nr:uncharacterized protein EKO05_0004586 [Ascochyta rabiei]UPX14095.1 hypothetical protein EKO05_0004586 [Ascochyta rabiei]